MPNTTSASDVEVILISLVVRGAEFHMPAVQPDHPESFHVRYASQIPLQCS